MNLKKCGSCKNELPATEEFFATRKLKTKSILQWQCRSCQKEYRRRHYEENKNKYIKKAKMYNKKVSKWFDEFKQTLYCSNCSKKDGGYWIFTI